MKKYFSIFFILPVLLSAQGNFKTWTVPGFGKAGPYSHATEANGFLFLSGMIPVNFETGQVDTLDIKIATHRVFHNLRAILTHCGSSLDSVVKVTVFLRDMKDFQAMNEAYETWFKGNFPARSTVAVRELPRNMPIEIEVTAIKKSQP